MPVGWRIASYLSVGSTFFPSCGHIEAYCTCVVSFCHCTTVSGLCRHVLFLCRHSIAAMMLSLLLAFWACVEKKFSCCLAECFLRDSMGDMSCLYRGMWCETRDWLNTTEGQDCQARTCIAWRCASWKALWEPVHTPLRLHCSTAN